MPFDWTAVIAFVVGILLPFIFASLLPNSKFYAWGFSAGKKLSGFMQGKVGKDAWEAMENNITGSFFAYAQGLKEGADSDDAPAKK